MNDYSVKGTALKSLSVAAAAVAMSLNAVGAVDPEILRPMPLPPYRPPIFRPGNIRADEKPVVVETARETVADNGLFRRVATTVTFTNPNARVFEGELEFPLPSGATVCGYALEVNGNMVPGVVCEKEAARTAFENEKRAGIDPGIVEHVKGNVWKTRIYPLMPNTPRKACVETIEPILEGGNESVVERDGDSVFVGARREATAAPRSERLKNATCATIWWDASMSRQGKVAEDRAMLNNLPEKGEWTLIVFRNIVEQGVAFTSRDELLAAIDALVYDGGTCIEKVTAGPEDFVFTDEFDADAAGQRKIFVRKLGPGEQPPAEPKEGTLLATAWAAEYIADHSASAESHKAEFLELGRRYGVASPVTSLIVLESLDQYLRYKIEPPKCMSFYDEWVRRRASEDDPIADARAKSEHMKRLLDLWEERVKWWNDPIPPRQTPSSGLFDRVARLASGRSNEAVHAAPVVETGMAADMDIAPEPAALHEDDDGMPAPSVPERRMMASVSANAAAGSGRARAAYSMAAKSATNGAPGSSMTATVTIAAWDPKTPYLKSLDAAGKDGAYAVYLKERETHGKAPAFYLDCGGWFFKAGECLLAVRILSNLTEMKLEDPALWRTMGWRLREAGAYAEAIEVFRHVLTMRAEEPQSKRDLALVLTEAGKAAKDAKMLTEAAQLLHTAAFERTARRSGRRGNDMQVSVVALEELNGLLAWCAANEVTIDAPAMDAVYRRDLPMKLRIVMSWDADETDVDLHVLEPDGEEAYYQHRRTSSGGFVSEDVTTGYGPEEYLRKECKRGKYRVLANYYASHRQALTGAAIVTATVYTDWASKDEKRQVLSFRLDKPKDKQPIGEVEIGD